MKIKWTGNEDITIRGVTFSKGKAVDVSDEDLAKKVLGIRGFEVATRKPPKKA